MQTIRTLSTVSLIIACHYLIYYLYMGLLNPIPALGDSYDYHIPIAQSILDGSFFNPSFTVARWFYPGSSEIFNSLFMLLGIPLTISNILPTILLFFCCWKLALVFGLKKYYALFFALTFITLNVIIRWANAVSIDMWVAVWFSLAIILLEQPKKSLLYFAKLGFILGMLIGSKYTTALLLITLTIFYAKKLLPYINIPRFLAFLLPFTAFGLFWYIRNYIVMHNPFYPLAVLGFQGPLASNDPMWREAILQPIVMFNAGFGEYKVWLFSVLIAVVVVIHHFIIKKQFYMTSVQKLFLIGLINFIFFLNFPTSGQPWIMVSSFRYSYPAFIPLILGVFLLVKTYKKESWIGYIAIASMISTLSLTYYPKLMLLSLPLALIFLYVVDRWLGETK